MWPRHLLWVMTLLSGCGSDFAPASFVKGLRLLAAKAEPPEAAPGASVQLRAYAVDTQGRSIDIAWAACLAPPNPGMGTISSECLTTDMGATLIPLGTGDAIMTRVPGVPSSVLLPPDITGGQYLPIKLKVTAQSDDDSSVYRLRLRPAGAGTGAGAGATAANRNPSLSSIDVVSERSGQVYARQSLPADRPFVVHANETLILRAEFSSDSAEQYVVLGGDGSVRNVTETLTAQWYATGGSLDNETSGADVDETFKADKHLAGAGSVIDLWVAGHDERGGSDLVHRQLLLQ
jgi:hypothetical protein